MHLPTAVGGNGLNLSRQMNRMGVHSKSLVVSKNYFDYGGDIVLADQQTNRLVLEMRRLKAFRYVFDYDVVFFNFGQTLYSPIPPQNTQNVAERWMEAMRNAFFRLMQKIELHILQSRGCTLLIQYQGNDARQGDFLRRHYPYSHVDEVDPDYYTVQGDAHRREQIALIAPKCHRVYALNPDLLNVLPADTEFLPYAHLDLDDWTPTFLPRESGTLRVGHAPSNRQFKGTQYVIDAVQALQAEGHDIHLDLVEGVTNREARRRYEQVDVVVDQLLCGWYGGLAVEAMALGKPVLAYIRNDDLRFVPPGLRDELPIVQADKHSIKEALLNLLQLDSASYKQLQLDSRVFVETWHDPTNIAQHILNAIDEAN
jgi:hypothetical protein